MSWNSKRRMRRFIYQFFLLHCWGYLRLNLLNTYPKTKKKKQTDKNKKENRKFQRRRVPRFASSYWLVTALLREFVVSCVAWIGSYKQHCAASTASLTLEFSFNVGAYEKLQVVECAWNYENLFSYSFTGCHPTSVTIAFVTQWYGNKWPCILQLSLGLPWIEKYSSTCI